MFWTVTLALLDGLGKAMELFGLTLLFSLPLGLVIAFASMSKWAPLRPLRHLRQLFLQGGVLRLQSSEITVILLLVVEPVRHSGIGVAERCRHRVCEVGQGGGGVAEKGHKGKSHGDDRRGKQNP